MFEIEGMLVDGDRRDPERVGLCGQVATRAWARCARAHEPPTDAARHERGRAARKHGDDSDAALRRDRRRGRVASPDHLVRRADAAHVLDLGCARQDPDHRSHSRCCRRFVRRRSDTSARGGYLVETLVDSTRNSDRRSRDVCGDGGRLGRNVLARTLIRKWWVGAWVSHALARASVRSPCGTRWCWARRHRIVRCWCRAAGNRAARRSCAPARHPWPTRWSRVRQANPSMPIAPAPKRARTSARHPMA